MFLAPFILAGLLAIGLPIWLHRVARANPTQFPFASHMFLEHSETQRTAKRTLRYLLLLAARILLLILLILAFAGPLVSPDVVPERATNARLHAIVIDGSMSMQHGERWQRALDEAEKVIASARSADRLMLVSAAGRRIQVIHEPTNDAGALRAQLRTLKTGAERLDYGLLMTTSKAWIGEPRMPAQIHLISDLQASAGPLRFADLEPPPGTELVLHDVADTANALDTNVNMFVHNASIATSDVRKLIAKIATNSPRPERRDVVLSIDGKQVGRRPVEFSAAPVALSSAEQGSEGGAVEGPPATRAVRNMEVEFPELTFGPGAHRIEVQLDPADAIAADDRYFAVLQNTDPKVLLVSRDTSSDESAYFGAAIQSLTAPRLAVDKQAAAAVDSLQLSSYAMIVLADVNALSGAAQSRIKDYVAGGGRLLMALAPGIARQKPALLADVNIGEVVTRPAQVGAVQSSHPILRNASDWHRVRFFRYLRLKPSEGDTVLVALEDGTPVLMERQQQGGRVLLLTAPLERDWNDLPIHPLFVQFIADAARYLVEQDPTTQTARVGAPVVTGLTAAGGGQIFDPQSRRVLALGEASAVDRFIPDQAGFYEIRGAGGQKWLAVNVDPRESDVTHMPASQVQRWQSLKAPPSRTELETTQAADGSPLKRSIGFLVFLIAAAFVVLELLMANHYLAVRREVAQ
jgi:Aerotolerance regulator N-terminal/von Willebrand factor type A domain